MHIFQSFSPQLCNIMKQTRAIYDSLRIPQAFSDPLPHLSFAYVDENLTTLIGPQLCSTQSETDSFCCSVHEALLEEAVFDQFQTLKITALVITRGDQIHDKIVFQ